MLGGIGDAFADRNFRIYSVGAIISWLSFFVQMVAVSWTTWELTHSTGWLAIIALLDVAPNVMFLPLGGVLADRFDRFKIVVITHALALLQALALAILAYAGTLTVVPLAILAFLHGLIHSFSVPGLYGMLPRYVEARRLASAIAVAASYTQLAIFAGPALAGWIILQYGAAAAFASNVAGYLIYLVSIACLRTPAGYAKPVPSGRSILGDLMEGLRYIGGHGGISALLLLMLMGDAISAGVYRMLPAFADETLGAGLPGLASLMGAAGFGATLGALWLAHGGVARTSSDRVLWAFLAFCLAVVALALAPGFGAALLIMLAYGYFGEIRATGTVLLLQTAVADSRRGRVMSMQFLLKRVAGGIGTVLIGAAAEQHGLRLPMLIAAVLATTAWLLAFRTRHRIAAAFVAEQA